MLVPLPYYVNIRFMCNIPCIHRSGSVVASAEASLDTTDSTAASSATLSAGTLDSATYSSVTKCKF